MSHPFSKHLRRAGVLTDVLVQQLDADAVDTALASDHLPEDVLPSALRPIVDAWSDYRSIAAADESLVGVATLPACVESLEECPADESSVRAIAELEAVVRQAIDGGTVRGRAVSSGHPGLEPYADHVDHVEALADISAHRCLALERAEKDGVLAREYRWPAEFVAPDWCSPVLSRCVAMTLHRRARSEAAWAGGDVLIDLVTSPRVSEPVAAIAKSGNKMALIIRATGGAVLSRCLCSVDDVIKRLATVVGRHGISILAVPAGTVDRSTLRIPRTVSVVPVRNVALHQAAKVFKGPRLEAIATAVAERVQNPRVAWGRLDPTTLGLVEYHQILDTAYVRLVLSLALQIAESQKTRVEAPRQASDLGFINKFEDLRAGMVVTGTVTQIAPFGAFVDIGVGREGLIHISQLSDDRVYRPTDVVHVGQRVTPKVISVDLDRGRISLSLLTSTRPRRSSDSSRKKALDALDKLFK